MTPQITTEQKGANFIDMLAPPDTARTGVAAAVFFFSLLVLPLAENHGVSLLFCVTSLVFLYLLVRSLFAMLFYLIPAVFLYGISGVLPAGNPLLLPASLFALLLGGACGAFLLLHYRDKKKLPLIALLPLAAFLLAFLLTGDIFHALLSLLPLVFAIAIAFAVARYLPQTTAVVIGAGTLAAALLIAGAITLLRFGASFSALPAAATGAIENTIASFFETASALYAEAGIDFPFSALVPQTVAATLINISPALFLVLCTVTAFYAWRVLMTLFLAFRSVPRLPLRFTALNVSTECAAIFLIASLLSLVGGDGVFAAVCRNVALVLEPILVLAGLRVILGGAARSCLSFILILVLAYFLWSNPAAGFAVTAAVGAVRILLAAFFPPSEEKGE